MAWEVYSFQRVKIRKALTSKTRALTVTVYHIRIMKRMTLSYFLILSGGRIFMYLFHIFSSLSFYNGFDMLLATQDALVMNERSCFLCFPALFLLFFMRSEREWPDAVFSFAPLKTTAFANLPRAILLTAFFFMARAWGESLCSGWALSTIQQTHIQLLPVHLILSRNWRHLKTPGKRVTYMHTSSNWD